MTKWEIIGDSAFPLLRAIFLPGDVLKADSGAMVAMSENMHLTAKADGGVGKAIARMFSGESFFMERLEAKGGPGWALLACGTPGAIAAVDINHAELTVQKGGFLAATEGVDISSKVQGLMRGMFSGDGFFVVKVTGQGTVFLSTYGSIYPLNIPAGESVIVDNGHLVAWDSHMQMDITKGGAGWISSVASGVGLACRFHGPGRVYIQTRNPTDLALWLQPLMPVQPASR